MNSNKAGKYFMDSLRDFSKTDVLANNDNIRNLSPDSLTASRNVDSIFNSINGEK